METEVKTNKYTHINSAERKVIERLLRQNTPKKQIARMLNRSITTIRKEIKRGSVEQRQEIKTTKKDINIPLHTSKFVYFADLAQKDYEKKRRNCGCKCKIVQCRDFVNFVERVVLEQKWSLDAAAGFVKLHHLYQSTCTTQTLYNWVDMGLCRIRNIDLNKKVQRKTHKEKSRQHKRLYGRSIEERPIKVEKRQEFGHWEGDGIVGKDKKGHLITLVERKTGMGLLFNVVDRQAFRIVDVLDELEEKLGNLFPVVFKTITFDNGTEFANAKAMEKFGRTKIYYAHPYSAWERGTNENWNGIVRRFIPKGKSFDGLQQQDMNRIENMINNLPRKRFKYQTPRDLFIREVQEIINTSVSIA